MALLLLAQPFYVVPDSAMYLAYGTSLLWDRDVDFANDYRRLGTVSHGVGGSELGAPTETGHLGNPFGVGCAILWLPFMVGGGLLAKLGGLAGLGSTRDGFGTSTVWAAHLGTWTFLLATLALVFRMLVEFFGECPSGSRRAAVIGACLGTPLVYYVLQMPSYSHVCALFCTGLIVYLALRWRARWTVGRAVTMGLVVGIAGLVRIQELVFVVFPVVLGWGGGALRPLTYRLIPIGLYFLSAAVAFVPQVIVWSAIYGTPWHIPQGAGFLHMSLGRLANVLVSTHHGLVVWSPILIPTIAGWGMLVRRRATRVLGVTVLIVFILQWLVNAMPNDWWAGWSFGARRFLDLVPLVTIGLLVFASVGRGARLLIYGLTGLNLVQWLRISSGDVSGEVDPGWNALWGVGLVRFVTHIPASFWKVVTTSPTSLSVLRRPEAWAPRLTDDPVWVFMVMFAVWVGLMLIVAHKTRGWWNVLPKSSEKNA